MYQEVGAKKRRNDEGKKRFPAAAPGQSVGRRPNSLCYLSPTLGGSSSAAPMAERTSPRREVVVVVVWVVWAAALQGAQ